MENGDFALAKVIIETAAIKVTKGSLSETFDEFGHKYQVWLSSILKTKASSYRTYRQKLLKNIFSTTFDYMFHLTLFDFRQ